MFEIDIEKHDFSDPWHLSYPDRLKALQGGQIRVAYYYERANNSTFRYRAYNMAQVLNNVESKKVSGSYFFEEDLQFFPEISEWAHILVICRSGYNAKINHLLTQFHNRNKRVLFDIDDFVFNTEYTHLIINTLGLDQEDNKVWEDWFAMISRMGQTLRLCDGAITTNTYLAARISEFFNQPVYVVPNFMNIEQLKISEDVFNAKNQTGFSRDDKIHLGYFSGSPSHNLDFAIIEAALATVMNEDNRVCLIVVGYIEPGPLLSTFGNRVIRAPFMDYVNLQALIGKVEFNLMPLQYNVFTNCKSELKYFEAAAVGTLSIATPSCNYQAVISDGVNGYIARGHEWASTIKRAISSMDQYQKMATNARNDALNRYSWVVQHTKILHALELDNTSCYQS